MRTFVSTSFAKFANGKYYSRSEQDPQSRAPTNVQPNYANGFLNSTNHMFHVYYVCVGMILPDMGVCRRGLLNSTAAEWLLQKDINGIKSL